MTIYSFPNLEPVRCFKSGSNCCFLPCIQISQEAGKVFWYCHLFRNIPQFVVIHKVKGFNVVSEAKLAVFLEFCCFLYDPTYVGNLISVSSVCSQSSLYIWKFSIQLLHLRNSAEANLKDFDHILASMCNCMIL